MSRASSRSSSSRSPPPCIQPSLRTARRRAASACPPTSSGIGSVGAGRHLRLRDVVELAVVLEEVARGQAADDVDALVHPLAALGARHAQQFVVLGPRAGADAEAEPVVEERRQRTGLLGDQRRRADRQLEHEGVEPQRGRHRAQCAGEDERLDERLAVEEFAVAVGGVGILRVRLERVGDAVGDGHRVVAGLLGGLGQRDVVRRVGHRLGIGEPHARILERVLIDAGAFRCRSWRERRWP